MLFNIFSDPKLRTRQDQLDAQWSSLNALQGKCNNVPDTAWVEFVNDLRAWRSFYDSGSDWSADSANATNVWQSKAQEWANKFGGWGCTGSLGSIGDIDIAPAPDADQGVPGVKDPPPDDSPWYTSLGMSVKGLVSGAVDEVTGAVKTVYWVYIGLIILAGIALVYLFTHAKVKTAEGSLG